LGIDLKSFVFLVASCCGSIGAHAQNLSNCSMFGDSPSLDVVTRVNPVRSGQVTPGPAVRLRREATLDCTDERHCYVEKSPPVQESMEGVEIGRRDAWICVAFPGKRPLDVWIGWISVQRWKAMTAEGSPAGWVGVWQNDYAKLWIKPSDNGQLAVKGDGIWTGELSSHFGDFSFVAKPEDGWLVTPTSSPPDQCRVALRRVGSFIFGADNGNCGAVNVSFDGVYRFRRGLK